MSDDSDAFQTVEFGENPDSDISHLLDGLVPGEWQRVDNAQALECDLGYGMCNLRIEKVGDRWVGKIAAVNPPTLERTEECADLEAAILQTRVLLRDHGLKLKERAEELIEIAADAPSGG